MAWNYKCEKCGATLDAGERCNCEKEQPRKDEGRQQAREEEITSNRRGRPRTPADDRLR